MVGRFAPVEDLKTAFVVGCEQLLSLIQSLFLLARQPCVCNSGI